MASAMDIDDEEVGLPSSSGGKEEKKRFEVKKVRIVFITTQYFELSVCLQIVKFTGRFLTSIALCHLDIV